MSKIYFLIGLLFIFTGCQKCKLEENLTHNVAIPIVESLAKYAKQNGIPKSFKDIKNFPYKLESCSKKSNIRECKILNDGYFFKKDGKYYSLKLWIYSINGFGIKIIHNTTNCGYDIYSNGKVNKNYYNPTCSLTGDCQQWGRQ